MNADRTAENCMLAALPVGLLVSFVFTKLGIVIMGIGLYCIATKLIDGLIGKSGKS